MSDHARSGDVPPDSEMMQTIALAAREAMDARRACKRSMADTIEAFKVLHLKLIHLETALEVAGLMPAAIESAQDEQSFTAAPVQDKQR